MAAAEMAERAAKSNRADNKEANEAEAKPTPSVLTLPLLVAGPLPSENKQNGSSPAETLVNGVLNFE
jgi:hypothetical protein